MRWLLAILGLSLLGIASAISVQGSRLLVVLEEFAEKEKYSKYFADLEAREYRISYESPKSESAALFELGERAYDHVLLLPTKAKGLGPSLTPKLLLDFVNAGGNILLALSGSTSTPSSIVSLLLELDIHIPSERNAMVIDHFNYDVNGSPEQHDVILVPRPKQLREGVREFFGGNGQADEIIAFPRGVPQALGNTSPLLTPILRAPRTAYTHSAKEDADEVSELFEAGEQMSLITAMQGRNSARLTVLGSAEALQDQWFDAKVKGVAAKKNMGTVNRAFAQEVTGWTFHEIGVLRVNGITHYLNEGGVRSNITNPTIYRVKNNVTYEISVSEYLWNAWTPFTPPPGDALQLEFSMLSPFHRLTLNPSQSIQNATIFTTSLRTPDQHGIFNFKVNHKRPFYNNIEEKNQVTVRHFAHDEFPRSWTISGAWPWISGVGVTITGWVAFVAVWLWSKPVRDPSMKKVQ